MAARIQGIARHALSTFMIGDTAVFSSNFEKLKTLLDGITAEDINLVVGTSKERSNGSYSKAPATHVSIFECPFFTLAVFILKKGCSIPLHDHPGMFGLCKVVHGQITVVSYDIQTEPSSNGKVDNFSKHQFHTHFKQRPVRCKKSIQTLDRNSETCVLTPTSNNHHSIHNYGTEPTAFIDILAPPYAQEKGRDCTYFRECNPPLNQVSTIAMDSCDSWITEIPPPLDFFCDTQPYRGPVVNLEIISQPPE
ncbi:2-aminoethanethiol dioxygenase-like [Acropora muricata]|uniref:2-aminoethanethiol dioxygenase-like n=1 Tax=Acropora millepora TaxID=45264 RepID=UPI001CF444BA|nr:2-aminoethanethiol dioxygenase-like [Acropora millepora]